ncbi:carboxylating nicotinate-nucleotide diphosphorylase [Thermoproteota archaeon]
MTDTALRQLLQNALTEDIPYGDITTDLTVMRDLGVSARLISKDDGIFYGQEIILGIFNLIDPDTKIKMNCANGQKIQNGTVICDIQGCLSCILKAERVMLNFVQRLSGVATTTRAFVDGLNDPAAAVLDTRKTTPLMRSLEKKAVLAGGGVNHRFGLSDMVLIKENHVSALEEQGQIHSLAERIQKFKKQNPEIAVELEIEALNQMDTLPIQDVDIIMFDNFSLSDIKKGIEMCRSRGIKAKIEVSGNITLETIGNYAGLGIDRISVGRLTHSVRALDLTLLISDKMGQSIGAEHVDHSVIKEK